jgi:hypothetical protein
VSKFDGFADAAASAGRKTKNRVEPAAKGRSTGKAKRDDPDYKQALAYVRRDTHKQVMGVLLAQEREFSDLVEELLTKWLKTNS